MKTPPSSVQRHRGLGPFSQKGELNVIIETPKGNRNKFKYDEKKVCSSSPGCCRREPHFRLISALCRPQWERMAIRLTSLVLMDEPAFVGCLIPARLIGMIRAEQSKKGKNKFERNDRLIAVPRESHNHRSVRTIKELNKNFVKELEHFFVSYNEMRGKKFKLLGCYERGGSPLRQPRNGERGPEDDRHRLRFQSFNGGRYIYAL
jgi:inorganic pyrophosphatase